MSLIKQWKEESGYTYGFIADLLGETVSKIQRYENGQKMGLSTQELLKKVYKLDRLIAGEPNDVLLLKYELSQLVGFSVEEFEEGRTKGEIRIERKALKALPKEPANLRLTTLENLINLRENGYTSVFRPNVHYDAGAVEAEIARKIYNKKRKKEIWEEKMRLNA